MPDDLVELHNDLAGKIVAGLVKPVLANGGSTGDILVLLESVMLGVFLFIDRSGGLAADPTTMTSHMARAVASRWAARREATRRGMN